MSAYGWYNISTPATIADPHEIAPSLRRRAQDFRPPVLEYGQIPNESFGPREFGMPHNFWMINSNRKNFDITKNLGFTRQGLKGEYRRKVQRVEPGDRIIFYVSGDRVFTATATVTKGYEEVKFSPWVREGRANWPYSIKIKPDVVLNTDQYIDAGLIAYRLEYLRKWAPEDWHMAFQGNLHLLSKGDFFLLETEMLKLRDGRDKALQRVDQELAAEAERATAQRERRRRNAERTAARSTREQREPPARPTDAVPDTPEATGNQPAAPPDPPAGGRTRSGQRNRRQPGRGRPRQPAQKTPRHDND